MRSAASKALILAAGDGTRLGALMKDRPKPLLQLLGLSLVERVLLTARDAGISEFVIVVGYLGDKVRGKLENDGRYGTITFVENDQWQLGNATSALKAREFLKDDFVLLMADHIFDGRILKALLSLRRTNSVVLAVERRKPGPEDTKVLETNGEIVAIGKDIHQSNCVDIGIFLCSPRIFAYIEEAVNEGKTELAAGIHKAAQHADARVFDITQVDEYVPAMRREIKPFCVDVDHEEDILRAKELLIDNACKGRNDLLATYVNKPIENFITARLASTSITPNQITILTNVVAYAATILFAKGYLLVGSLVTFIVSFMDGVDGKLSRVKMAGSNLGKMEHAFDFLFEHSWYIALALYLSAAHGASALLLCILILLFDGFSQHCGRAFGKGIKERPLHDYGPIERLFRKFDGRKNSYIIFILVGILLNVPFWSLVAVAAWSFISAAFYASRTILHLSRADKGITSGHMALGSADPPPRGGAAKVGRAAGDWSG